MTAPTSAGERLIDYFVVCGLDNVSGLEPDQLLGDSHHVPPLERSYRAKTLAHYPDHVPWNPFDEHAVCMLSLPNGLQFKLNTETHNPSFHSFLITREDGSRMNGFSLTFYEKVKDYEICQAMQVLQDMYIAELALSSNNSRSHSAVHFHSHIEGFHSYERKNFPSPTRKGIKLYDSEEHNLLVSKSLCLVMPFPFVSAAKSCLNKIYQGGLSEGTLSLTMECYLYNLIYEVPLPPPGRNLKFTCIRDDVLCQRPGENELPLLDYPLEDVFNLIGVKDFIKLISCVMLEHQILILGSDLYTFMLVAETIVSLIFPYNWQHVYVPILPASLLHFLEAPVPFIMGLYCKDTDDIDDFLPSKSSLCCLDINNRVLTVPEELPDLPFAEELARDLSEVLVKFNSKRIKSVLKMDSSTSPTNRKKKSLDERVTARKSVKKLDVRKAGSSYLRAAKSVSNLSIQENPRLASLDKVARKTGIQTNLNMQKYKSLTDINNMDPKLNDMTKALDSGMIRQYEFNAEVREILLNWFTQIFLDYESFVIHPKDDQDVEEWIQNREEMENFDKTAFLSDQPATFLSFLSPFIETQMFASFIDAKLISLPERDSRFDLFDQRISSMKNRLDINRSHSYEKCQSTKSSVQILYRRTNSVDHTAPSPHVLDVEIRRALGDGFFPELIEDAFLCDDVDSARRAQRINWRRRDRQKQHSEHLLLNSAMKQDGKKMREKLAVSIKKYLQENENTRSPKSQLGDMSLSSSDAHINFIQRLLTECKARTKRMLVMKMGQEARDLGHNDANGVEENSLIAGLCDLLDRIWGHGPYDLKAKSPLWLHIMSYYNSWEGDEMNMNEGSSNSPCQRSQMSSPVLQHRQFARRSTSPEQSQIRSESPAARRVSMETKALMADVRSVKNLTEIKTDNGCLRAFVRLALEKKALSKHLKTLLNDKEILRKYYKNYAFVRTEEEREQFLVYILSLNAVEYFCFTNCFTTLAITYKVVIVTGKQLGGSTTTANVWMILAGEIKDTGIIYVPKGGCEFRFQHPNVGKLTTLRIGHDNSGYAPGWFVEHVLVRNEITGHLYRFPCGRWLSKSNDDGSTERLLVGELQRIHNNNNNEDMSHSTSNSPQRRSPVMTKKNAEKNKIPVVQENLANAVNKIVKYFCTEESEERGYLTYLLCGENGLCDSLEQVFHYGFKSARIFQKNFFIWDFIEKVNMYLKSDEGTYILTEQRPAKLSFCSVVQKINDASQTVGKDGKFQTFICLGVRDHSLEKWFPLISICPVTTNMYEQNSFLRDKGLIRYLVNVLGSLAEYNIVLEASLLKGLS